MFLIYVPRRFVNKSESGIHLRMDDLLVSSETDILVLAGEGLEMLSLMLKMGA